MKTPTQQFAQTPQGIVVCVIVGTLGWKYIGSRMMMAFPSRTPSFFQTWTGALVMGAVVAGILYFTLDNVLDLV